MKTKDFYLLVISVFLFMGGCAVKIAKPPELLPPLVLIKADESPSFADDLDQKSLELAIGRSLQYYDRLPEERIFRFGKSVYTVRELKESLLEFMEIIRSSGPDESREKRIRDAFDVYQLSLIHI